MFQPITQAHWLRNVNTHCCYLLNEVKIFVNYDAKKFHAVCLIYWAWIYFYVRQNEILYVGEINEYTIFNVYFKLIDRNATENTCKLIAQFGWNWSGCSIYKSIR